LNIEQFERPEPWRFDDVWSKKYVVGIFLVLKNNTVMNKDKDIKHN